MFKKLEQILEEGLLKGEEYLLKNYRLKATDKEINFIHEGNKVRLRFGKVVDSCRISYLYDNGVIRNIKTIKNNKVTGKEDILEEKFETIGTTRICYKYKNGEFQNDIQYITFKDETFKNKVYEQRQKNGKEYYYCKRKYDENGKLKRVETDKYIREFIYIDENKEIEIFYKKDGKVSAYMYEKNIIENDKNIILTTDLISGMERHKVIKSENYKEQYLNYRKDYFIVLDDDIFKVTKHYKKSKREILDYELYSVSIEYTYKGVDFELYASLV